MANPKLKYEITALDKTKAVLSKVEANFKKLSKISIGAITAATAGLSVGVARANAEIDKLAKTSAKLGISTEKLAGLQLAFEQTGVSIETGNMALQRMVRRVSEAGRGTGEAVKALQELGLNAQALADLSPDEQFKAIAGAMGNVATQGDKVRLAMKLFDSEGVALVNTLNSGVGGLADFDAQAQKLGLTLSNLDVTKVELANDRANLARRAFTGFTRQLSIQFAPILGTITNMFLGLTENMGGAGNMAKKVTDSMVAGFGFVFDAVNGVKVVIAGLQYGFAHFADQLGKAVKQIIDIYNSVASFANLPQITTTFFDALSQKYAENAQNLKTIMDDKLTAPVPSEKIGAMVESFTKDFEDQAKIAAEGKALSIPELVGGKKDKKDPEQKSAGSAFASMFGFSPKQLDAEQNTVLGNTFDFLNSKKGALEKGSKEAKAVAVADFLFNKNNAITQSIVQTQLAASKAIGAFPGPAGIAMAAGIIALGGAYTAKIAQQSLSGARAMGGPVMPGQSYLVGERGPEIFTPQTGGQVVSNANSMGGVTVNIINAPQGTSATYNERDRVIDVVIGDLETNGRFSRTLQQRTNVRRVGV